MAGTLELYGVDGRKRRETIPKEEILKEEVLQNVEDDKGCCVLKLFATSEHIVDDTLTITCSKSMILTCNDIDPDKNIT